MSVNNPPKFVRLNGTAMRLTMSDKRYWDDIPYPRYTRDCGAWGVRFQKKQDGYYSVSRMEELNDIKLIPITIKEWFEDDGYHYVPSSQVGFKSQYKKGDTVNGKLILEVFVRKSQKYPRGIAYYNYTTSYTNEVITTVCLEDENTFTS